MGVAGDHGAMINGIRTSDWFKWLSNEKHFADFGPSTVWESQSKFPLPPYPRTPVGHLVYEMLDNAKLAPFALPTGIVTPGSDGYATRSGLSNALKAWPASAGPLPPNWKIPDEQLWSDIKRSACNMCGFCGEYLCWGKEAPKFGTQATTLKEFEKLDASVAQVICNAKVFEITTEIAASGTYRATGVRYLDISNPDDPHLCSAKSRHVIVSCGAVQSARLLMMSGPPHGLGNHRVDGHLGRHATFHQFGLTAKLVLKPEFQGTVHGEYAHTGNTSSFGPYFLKNPISGKWIKCGTLTSTAKKNPMQNAFDAAGSEIKSRRKLGIDLMKSIDEHTRTVEIRVTADDLPMYRNRVDLDPTFVDEYGFPVARITRDLGPAEWQSYALVEAELNRIIKPFQGALVSSRISPAIVDLIGDHQMGTCRMANNAKDGVINAVCSVFEAPNVFVVDSSFMPTGLGLNPMVSVVANALRVGTHMVMQEKANRPTWESPA